MTISEQILDLCGVCKKAMLRRIVHTLRYMQQEGMKASLGVFQEFSQSCNAGTWTERTSFCIQSQGTSFPAISLTANTADLQHPTPHIKTGAY